MKLSDPGVFVAMKKISLKNKKYIYWAVSFISITVILFSIYYLLGGFEEIDFLGHILGQRQIRSELREPGNRK